MRFFRSSRRLGRFLHGLHRDEDGIESVEWMTTGLILCALIIYFATGLIDPLMQMFFDALAGVNPG
jgi:hypothetical protein